MDQLVFNGLWNASDVIDSDEFPSCLDNDSHASMILNQLDKDRKGEQEFCDATIAVESRSFSVHKCIIAAASLFFRKMFSSKMKEKYESKATIMSVSAETMEIILDFIYTCRLNLTEENVYDILCAADYLQMQHMKDMCSFYLRDSLNAKNCFVMWNFAKLYNMQNLTFLTEMFISANFNPLLKQGDYKQLNVNSFKDYLALRNSDTVETDIYNAVIDWVQHDEAIRTEQLQEVFPRVNLSQVSKEFLKDTICQEDLLHKSPACAKLVIDALCQQMSSAKEETRELLIIGGNPSEQEVLKLNVSTKELTDLPNMPSGRSGASAVVVGEFIYVLGGHSWSSDASKSFNSVITFNLKQANGMWTGTQQMNKPRRCAGCAVMNGYIYMCGGKAHNTMWLSSCERFNINSKCWFAISDMNHKRSEFALVNLNNRLYAIGGCNRPNSFLNSVETFVPDQGIWVMVTPMITSRARFAAAVCNGEIFVVGGESDTDYLDTVEKFSPATGMWTFVASLSETRFNHAACALGNDIFVFGGNNRLEFYDTTKDEWNTAMLVSRKLGCSLVAL